MKKGELKMKKPLISFPHLGNYSVPIYYFLSNVTKMDVMIAPNITKRTIEFSIYKAIKKLNPKIKFLKYLYYLINTILMIYFIDKIENYTRLNVGFEIIKNSFKNTNKRMLNEFKQTKGIIDLFKKYHKYKKVIRKIKVNKPINPIRIGIIGELYTSMEQFSSYYIEEMLAQYNIEVKRFTNLTYLLIQKKFKIKKMLSMN